MFLRRKWLIMWNDCVYDQFKNQNTNILFFEEGKWNLKIYDIHGRVWRVGFWLVGIYNSSGISHYHHWVAGSELLVVGGWILLACQRMEKNIGQSNCPSLFIEKNKSILFTITIIKIWKLKGIFFSSIFSSLVKFIQCEHFGNDSKNQNPTNWSKQASMKEALRFSFNNLLWLLGSHGSCDGGAEYDMMDSLTSMSNWHQGGNPLQPNWHWDARPQNTR